MLRFEPWAEDTKTEVTGIASTSVDGELYWALSKDGTIGVGENWITGPETYYIVSVEIL